MSNVDKIIDENISEISKKIEDLKTDLSEQRKKIQTNGYILNSNIYSVQSESELFVIAQELVKLRLIQKETFKELDGLVDEDSPEFQIYLEHCRRPRITYEQAISEVKIAISILKLKKQIQKVQSIYDQLIKRYSDEKRNFLEVNSLIEKAKLI